MKIAIVRGQYLNKFEMQNIAPLENKYDIIAYTTHSNIFDTRNVGIPLKKLYSIESISRLAYGLVRRGSEKLLCRFGLENYIFGLEKELHGCDIVHTAETSTRYSYQVIKLKKKIGFKVVATVWENIPYREECFFTHIKGMDHRKRVVRENVDMFIAVTEKAKEALLLEGVKEDKIHVIHPGIDLSRFKPLSAGETLLREQGFSKDNFVILFIGRLVYEKGIYDLLLAAKKIIEDIDLSKFLPRFLIVGSGPEHVNVLRLLNEWRIEKYFKLKGNIIYDEIPYYYNLADIFVLPSLPVRTWQEQFGMVLVEAMASGLPVITTFCGSIPEVIGNTGRLIPAGNSFMLYREIKNLILNKTLRDGLGKKARERAEKEFDSIKCAEKIADIYGSLSKQDD